MPTVPLNTVSTVDAVCTSLENDIYSLYYGPGAKIREKDLSDRYGVSRNTVREAVAYLLTSGLLVKYANRGVYVRKITIDDICEIFHLRELLEGEAIRLIVASQHMPEELLRAAEAVAAIDPAQDWHESIHKDMAFHLLLVQCSGSQRLVRLYESILSEVKLCVYQSYDFINQNFIPVSAENSAHHMNILNAMQRGDLNGALKYLSLHIAVATSNYSAGYLKKESLQGRKK